MGFVHGKNSRLLLGTSLFSAFLRSFEDGSDIDMADSTVYGSEGHNFTPGLESGAISMGGLMDSSTAATGQDGTLKTALTAAAGSLITAAPAGLAVGERVSLMETRETNYAVTSPVGDMVSFAASWQSEGQVDSGRVLHDHTAETATANGTNVDNGALTSGGAALYLHVTANTRSTSTTIKVQHSVDNSVWVDLGSAFTAVGAGLTAAERVVVPAGTVNRHLRAVWTLTPGTGSITFAVSAARR